MEHEDRDEEAVAEPAQRRAHGCVQRLTLAIGFVVLYLLAFWAGVGFVIYWLATRL